MGQPAVKASCREYIPTGGQTRRTETSKYPEEEKETSISLVAASEKERAQTKELALWGCGHSIKEEDP